MKIFVDADSCPRQARDLVVRRAIKLNVPAIFAANRSIPGVQGNDITMEICSSEEGAADKRIAELAEDGDLAVSRDVPLAQILVEKGVTVINDRGRIFTKENVGEMLSLRNFTVALANNGMEYERSASYGKKDLKNFADSFDKIINKLMKLALMKNAKTKFQDTGSASV